MGVFNQLKQAGMRLSDLGGTLKDFGHQVKDNMKQNAAEEKKAKQSSPNQGGAEKGKTTADALIDACKNFVEQMQKIQILKPLQESMSKGTALARNATNDISKAVEKMFPEHKAQSSANQSAASAADNINRVNQPGL